jgi:hypothetical protein
LVDEGLFVGDAAIKALSKEDTDFGSLLAQANEVIDGIAMRDEEPPQV